MRPLSRAMFKPPRIKKLPCTQPHRNLCSDNSRHPPRPAASLLMTRKIYVFHCCSSSYRNGFGFVQSLKVTHTTPVLRQRYTTSNCNGSEDSVRYDDEPSAQFWDTCVLGSALHPGYQCRLIFFKSKYPKTLPQLQNDKSKSRSRHATFSTVRNSLLLLSFFESTVQVLLLAAQRNVWTQVSNYSNGNAAPISCLSWTVPGHLSNSNRIFQCIRSSILFIFGMLSNPYCDIHLKLRCPTPTSCALGAVQKINLHIFGQFDKRGNVQSWLAAWLHTTVFPNHYVSIVIVMDVEIHCASHCTCILQVPHLINRQGKKAPKQQAKPRRSKGKEGK